MDQSDSIKSARQRGSLGEYLALSRSLGQFDSEAEFTLDLRHAFESLKKFTLAEPGNYLRYLVASAIARGADKVEVATGHRTLIVRDNGHPLEPPQAERVFVSLLNKPTRENAGLRYLAVGLWGARNWGCRSAEADFRTVRIRLTAEDVRIDPVLSEERDWNVVTVIERKGLGTMLSSLVTKQSWSHLRSALYCLRYAKADITLDGEPVNEAHPALSGPTIELEPREHPVPHHGWLAQSRHPDQPLSLIVHGIAYDINLEVGGVIHCEHLHADASFQRLVKTHTLHELLLSLRKHLRESAFAQLKSAAGALDGCRLALEFLHSDEGESFRAELFEKAVFESETGPVSLQELREKHLTNACLLLDSNLLLYQTLLNDLFYPLVLPSQKISGSAQEVLNSPALAIATDSGLAHCLRFTGTLDTPFTSALFDDTEEYMAKPEGPYGFQIVSLQRGFPLAGACGRLLELLHQAGSRLISRIHLGEFTAAQASPFFSCALHWIHRNEMIDKRFLGWQSYLRFRREAAPPASLAEILDGWELFYRGEDDQPSGHGRCLILNEREVELLDFHQIQPRYYNENNSPERPMRRIDLTP